MDGKQQCIFYCRKGLRCKELTVNNNSFCFWHCKNENKTGTEIKGLLEQRIKDKLPLTGFQLKGAKLDGIHFSSTDHRQRTDLTDINLKRASLYGAHLYQVDFSGACLMKATLDHATLNAAKLEGCNMLGASLTGAKLENVCWGKTLHQEIKLKQLKHKKASVDEIKQVYQEAEEVSRQLRRVCEVSGLSDEAGKFFYKEMRFRRFAQPLLSKKRFFSWFFDRLCGYGEKPFRLISFSVLFILACAIGFFSLGVNDGGSIAVYQSSSSLSENFLQFAECLYFSVVTFTTLGYGDITPVGISRFIASVEAFIGSFTIALYVVVFVRRMAR